MPYKFAVGDRVVVARPESGMARYKGRCATIRRRDSDDRCAYALSGLPFWFAAAELDHAPKKKKAKKKAK